MPIWQCMAERLNIALSHENIGKLDEALLAKLGTTGPLDEFLRDINICQTDRELEYLKSWPEGLQDVLHAAIRSAIHRSPSLPVTISWAPGYDFEVNVWEAPGTPESLGGMTILLRSRYPADTHPTQQ